MTDAARKLLADAMALAGPERATVAAALLASLDAPGATDLSDIEQRAERVLAGDSNGAPWETVRARLLARVAPR